MFYWICPCGYENLYSGSKTTNVVVTCHGCKAVIKASSHKRPEKKEKNREILPRTTKKLPILKTNGSVQSLIIALNYAINTIKNKDSVKDKDIDSTWYQHFKSWTGWRSYLQALEGEK